MTIRPLAFTMVLALATSVAAQEPAPTQTPAPAGDTAADPNALDHATHVPGPPTLTCRCNTNPIFLTWAADTRRVEQPLLYRMVIGSRPGQEDLGVYDMGLTTSWTANAAPGVNYYIRIAAVNWFGGHYSNEVNVNVGATVLSGTLSGRVLTLRWTGSPTVTLYYSNHVLFATYGSVAVSGNQASFTVPPGVYYLVLWNGTQWSNFLTATVQ